MLISTADAILLDLPLVEPFAAAHGTTRSRTVVIIRLEGEDGPVGWGECSALPAATYTAESAAGSYQLLTDHLLPTIVGQPLTVATLDPLRRQHADAPMAMAGIEMALIDAQLKTEHRSLAQWLGATSSTVPAGVSLGLAPVDQVATQARALVAEGYRRLKIKIEPGHDRAVVDAVRTDPTIRDLVAATEDRRPDRDPTPNFELHLDGNGAYGADDVDLLVSLTSSGSTAGADVLEQPLAPAEVNAATQLVQRLADRWSNDSGGLGPVPVVADEAVATMGDVERLADRRAITGVSIKPARVGGLLAARAMHDRCRELGLRATAGGMLETGLGRRALASLAALPGFDLTGDLSPAGRWLATDPWPDLTMTAGQILVPDGPGVAPEPDLDLLDHHTVRRERLSS